MAQETRKDPRAKVLTVTVRYKSATLDEFIEQHSHDVSRGGMFIKTVSPFPAGTLLKIEVRIAGDQRVMQGVGRVVWKRESTEAHDGAPAGMGVKFIKIDDASRSVIDQLVAKSGGAVSAFERGGGEAATPAAAPAAAVAVASASSTTAAAVETATAAARKQTMIGLGGLATETPKVEDEQPPTGFFPESDGPAEQPAPEDRTVMKQAAELLQDALREAGGSLDEVGTPGASSHPPPPVYEPPRPGKSTAPAGNSGAAAAKAEGAKPEADAKAASPEPSAKPASAKAASAKAASAKPAGAKAAGSPRPSQRPASTGSAQRRPAISASEAPSESGGGRIVWIALAIAAIGGGLFVLTRSPEPPPATEVKQEVPPPAPVEAKPAEPAATAPSEPVPPPVALSALPTEDTPPVASAAPTVSVKKPKPFVAPKPAAPVAPKPPSEPLAPATPPPAAATPPVAATPPAPTPPAAPTAAEPKPTAAPTPPATAAPAEPKPTAEPKPKAPAPPKAASDNPF